MCVSDLTSRIRAREAQQRRDAGRCGTCGAEPNKAHLSCECGALTADGLHCTVCGLGIEMCALTKMYNVDGPESA